MFRPKLFSSLRDYTVAKFINDVIAGLIVGIVALPLAIAFGIASGVSPERGLFTAIVAGFLISLLGGSRVQIGGPTGAFVVVVFGIVEKHGIEGLAVATFLAGVLLVIMGLARFGSLIKFIPHPLVVGFTSGIAVIILVSQIKDFLGLQIEKMPGEFLEKIQMLAANVQTLNPSALAISVGSLLLIIVWQRFVKRIPGSLVALIISTLAVYFFDLPVETIGSRFGEIPSTLPAPTLPAFSLATIRDLAQPILIITILAAIESLLSAVVADGMTGGKHRSNTELIAQGIANMASPIFGGIPATGALARTATNIKNGGRTPVAGMIHALVLLAIMLFFGKLARLIPLPTLAAILVMVAYNMSEWRTFVSLLKNPVSDILVLLVTFLLTVVVDLTVAIEVGLVLAMFLFMRRMALITNIGVYTNGLDEEEEDADDPLSISRRDVPPGVAVFEINGPLFFGAAYKFEEAMTTIATPPRVLIIRMRNVPAIDATGLKVIEEVHRSSSEKGTTLVISGVHSQPLFAMEKAGLIKILGEENIFGNIDDALNRARSILS
ncbi:MAG: sulfate permease [Spirochaetia bacterium]|nr:sulfate permease [Spirochaetia bacterium]